MKKFNLDEWIAEQPIDTSRSYADITAAALRKGYAKGFEQGAREAFKAGHDAKMRQQYNSAIMRNFPQAAGRFITCEEAFIEYWEQKLKEK